MLGPAPIDLAELIGWDGRDRGLHLRGTLVVASDFPFNKMVAQTSGDNSADHLRMVDHHRLHLRSGTATIKRNS